MSDDEDSSRHTLSSHLNAALSPTKTSITKRKRIARRSVYSDDKTFNLLNISGYLQKKSSNGRWQRRFFYVNNAYLIYKSKQSSTSIDATIDLRTASTILVVGRFGDMLIEFEDDQAYAMRGRDNKEATTWVDALKKRKDYYNTIQLAGQSEVSELFLEEVKQADTHTVVQPMSFSNKSLTATAQLSSKFRSNVLNQCENQEVDYDGWLFKKSPSKWLSYQEVSLVDALELGVDSVIRLFLPFFEISH